MGSPIHLRLGFGAYWRNKEHAPRKKKKTCIFFKIKSCGGHNRTHVLNCRYVWPGRSSLLW
jgi:hypothetical protein